MQKKVLFIFVSALFFIFIISNVYATVESDFQSLVNSERASLGKLPVQINENLTLSAYLHSKEMADKSYFSHNSFDNSTFDKRIKAAGYVGYMALGENIAYASGDADANRIFNMWKNSPGHYANMISDSFNEIGLGIYSKNGLTYYTQDLGKRFNFIPAKADTNASLNAANPSGNTKTINNTNPIANNTSPAPKQNSGILFSSVNISETKSKIYKFVKIKGSLNEKSSVYYYLDGNAHRICSNCNKFSISIRTKISANQLILKANNDSRIMEI